jgi:hypothetical protein
MIKLETLCPRGWYLPCLYTLIAGSCNVKMKIAILSTLLLSQVLAVPTKSYQYGSECEHYAYASFEGDICGVLVFKGMVDTTVVVETLGDGISGLDESFGPFPYHGISPTCVAYTVHVNSVPTDGNCTACGGHLDPKHVGDAFVCNPNAPECCQVYFLR